MEENKEFLGTEPIPKLLFKLAVIAVTFTGILFYIQFKKAMKQLQE